MAPALLCPEPVAKGYSQGFAADDPVGAFVNSLPSDTRNAVVQSLKENGYPIADVHFEEGDPAAIEGWLISAARFFDETIGRNLDGLALQAAVGAHYHPPVVDPGWDTVCEVAPICADLLVWWCTGCTPEDVSGEWQPDGEACECRTDGPWSAACGHFTADAEGKISTRIPFPPPLGTEIELAVGVGVSIDLCVCVWQRTCMANSKRSVTTVHADCTRSVWTEVGPQMAFTNYGWTFAFPADQCQLAGRPPCIPPDDQDCGLGTPTP